MLEITIRLIGYTVGVPIKEVTVIADNTTTELGMFDPTQAEELATTLRAAADELVDD